MNSIFPFDLDSTTIFYIALYVLTLVVHAVFMSYVLAGSIWLAFTSLPLKRPPIRVQSTDMNELLRDWMPFVLSAVITAGVAPLLFVQILYPTAFYSANLLLNWRWMVVVPAITVSFYLLYLQKSPRLVERFRLSRSVLSAVIGASFLFVAFCWTANHQLSMTADRWPDVYAGAGVLASTSGTMWRLLTWVAGTFPVMAVFVGWQLYATGSGGTPRTLEPPVSETLVAEPVSPDRILGRLAIAGSVMAAVFATVYVSQLPELIRTPLLNRVGLPWFGAVGIGLAIQLVGWLAQRKVRQLTMIGLILCTLGSLMTLTGVGFLREIIRFVTLQGFEVRTGVAEAREVGGFAIFVVFAVLNVILIGVSVAIIRPAIRQEGPHAE